MGVKFVSSAAQAEIDRAVDAMTAFSLSHAIIEFDLQGKILAANPGFLSALGYQLAEVQGKHHRMFVDPTYAASAEYAAFWHKLAKGETVSATFKRVGKGGKEVWIEASYNPLLGRDGKAYRVIKIATDVTEKQLESRDARAKLEPVSRAMAVIEFDLDGTVLTANKNFCTTMGYSLSEIVGQHHRMFVPPELAKSAEYAEFWAKLRRGEFASDEYLRIGKGGKEVWIQASYNAVFDDDGKTYRVVKYATDITARKSAINALGAQMQLLAAGNLICAIETPFPGDLDSIRMAFNDTVHKFNGIIRKLRTTSAELRSATGEILAGTNDLADRTTRNAAAIEETSAAVTQLSQIVAENATRTETANTNAISVATVSEEAGTVMTQATHAMEDISSSSAKISNIIGMIDDIAFQTNLLALNASVEAARAGDAGKGFAVVAVEVRRLAQSAAGASADVKALVEQSVAGVAVGSRLVSSAATKLNAVSARVQENTGLMGEIARANAAQARSIAEVATAIHQMDEMTQHNAALVEQTNAAIEQTEGQATELDQLVDVFVLETASGRPADRSSAAPARPAAKVYVSRGNAAVSTDWNAF
ncbi:MAG: methyl-accepting chemotaxis protein [Devosia sp.]